MQSVLYIYRIMKTSPPTSPPEDGGEFDNDVREQVVAFLKELDGGVYLPRRRHMILSESENGAGPEPPGRSNATS